MVHRDDREAMRARLEAMERQLADAREETEAARAEAAAARRAAEDAAEPTRAAKKKKEKKEKKKRKRAPTAEEAPVEAGARAPWTPTQRWTFALTSGLLCLVAYGLPVPWLSNLAEDDDAIFAGLMLGSTALLVAGHALLAWFLRAPSGVGPPTGLSTVLGGVPFIALIYFAPLEFYDFLPEGWRGIGHAIGAGAAVVAGAVIVSATITNAASEPSSG